MSMIKARTFWNYDPVEVSNATGLECKDPSLAVQAQKEEADINNIVRNFGITGQLPVGVRPPIYEDFDEIIDYRTAIERTREAEESFMKMPSDLRARLNHDPQAFLEYCADPANLEEMRKLGLAVAPVAPPSSPSASEAS